MKDPVTHSAAGAVRPARGGGAGHERRQTRERPKYYREYYAG